MKAKSVTKAGFEGLSEMIMALKEKQGLEWFAFTDWVMERSGIKISKDVLYRTANGFHKTAPSLEPLMALAKTPEFAYLGSTAHPNLEQICEILFGERDAYGKPIEAESQGQAE